MTTKEATIEKYLYIFNETIKDLYSDIVKNNVKHNKEIYNQCGLLLSELKGCVIGYNLLSDTKQVLEINKRLDSDICTYNLKNSKSQQEDTERFIF